MYQRDNGIVEFDSDVCIGCKACLQACPYDAIYIDPDSHTAAKCHFCGHRVDAGLEPACVVVCPEHAILAGDLDDPHSEISQVLAKNSVTVRKPEQGTSPKLFYIQGNEVGLHPSFLSQTENDYLFADRVSEQHPSDDRDHSSSTRTSYSGASLRAPQQQGLPSEGPVHFGGRSAGHMVQVAYNAQHAIPWHWPIPVYILTKGTAAGIAFILGLGAVLGLFEPSAPAMAVGGAIAVAMMAITLGLLIYDLERPERALYLFIRPQWRSWVARAAWILAAFSLLGGLVWLLEFCSWMGWLNPSVLFWPRALLVGPILVLACLTAVYTAFLFAQAEGRDMWQSQVTPVHMALQSLYMGAGVLLCLGLWLPLEPTLLTVSKTLFIGCVALSGITILGAEFGVARASEQAAQAVHAIKRGRYRVHFWWGGLALGHIAPLLLISAQVPFASLLATIAAGIGLYAYETAYVMAPQHIANS